MGSNNSESPPTKLFKTVANSGIFVLLADAGYLILDTGNLIVDGGNSILDIVIPNPDKPELKIED